MNDLDIFKFLSNTDNDVSDIMDKIGDDVCDYCETNIIEGYSMTSHFMCEGAYCETATEQYAEDFIDEFIIRRVDICKMILNNQKDNINLQ